MENNQVEQELNEKTDNRFGYKLKGATLDKKSGVCYAEIFYNDGVILTSKDKQISEELLLSLLPKGFSYEFKFIKNFVANEAVIDFINQYFKKNHPSIHFSIKKADCEGAEKKVIISVDEQVSKYVSERGIDKELKACIKENFSVWVEVLFETTVEVAQDYEDTDEIDLQSFMPALPDRYIEVSEVEPLVGNLTDNLAYYIKDKTVPEEEAVVCGKVLFIKEYSYQPKTKDKKTDKVEQKTEANEQSKAEEKGADEPSGEEAGEKQENKNERKYFKFVVEDFTGKINCVFFASKQNYESMLKLEGKSTVIISGKLEPDKFSDGVSMRVKNISKCKLPDDFKEEIVYKSEPKAYKYVFPEPVEYYSQVDLFTTEDKKVNEFLLNNDLVVFDFETTGLDLSGNDKIIEIGAVKVVKGKITERFMCFVDPKMHIPEKSTAIHGITDADVKGAPTYDEALQDFYKFTRNCYLSGYNIVGFDCIFLTYFGRKCGYNFDNPVVDVYKLAQQGVRGVKNYKLKTVAEKLGVNLDNAHRAVFDTIATAEVLFKLSEYMEIKEE